jgi:hypothetical protein
MFFMEDQAMRPITVNDKSDIKQLLYGEHVLGIRDNNCHSFGGFELWWYDRQRDVCRCCRSRWSDFRKQIEEHSLDHAATLLWHNRGTLFLRHKVVSQDRKLQYLTQLCN